MPLDPRIPLMVDNSNIFNPVKAQQQQQELQMGQAKLAQVPLQNQAMQQQLDSGKLQQLLQKNEALGQLAAGVTDETSWRSALGQAKQMGIDTSKYDAMPYNPDLVKQIQMQSVSVKDHLTMQLRAADDARQDAALNETTRHNKAIEGVYGAYGKAPSGYSYGPDGNLMPIPGGPSDPANKPMTETQGKAGLFTSRMSDAEPIISDLGGKVGTDPSERAKASVPLVGNYLVSSDYQKLDQAERNFVNATLRQESGAAINQSEFDNAIKQYFPRPGDGPEVIKQKAQNRATAIREMGNAAGPAYTAKHANPAVPKVGDIEDGYIFSGGDPANPKSWRKK